MYRTLVILRHTFRESVVQPIYGLLLAVGSVVLILFGRLPFFTLGEDAKMFMSVGLDTILLLTLIATLFATSKSIYEEIEDRTMLTLMSKPVKKWEVIVGKYLGIMLSALLAVAVMGAVLAMCLWLRIPNDYMLRPNSLDERDVRTAMEIRRMSLIGLGSSLFLAWLQVGVLAAIGVALSTRLSLVLNLPVTLLLYFAGNLTRFLVGSADQPGGLLYDRGVVVKAAAYLLSQVLPYLAIFDVRGKTVYSTLALPGSKFAADPHAVALSSIFCDVGLATLYAVTYSVFALSVGLWLFQRRELGGAEG